MTDHHHLRAPNEADEAAEQKLGTAICEVLNSHAGGGSMNPNSVLIALMTIIAFTIGQIECPGCRMMARELVEKMLPDFLNQFDKTPGADPGTHHTH